MTSSHGRGLDCRRIPKTFWILGAILFFPIVFTGLHLQHWLRVHNCLLLGFDSEVEIRCNDGWKRSEYLDSSLPPSLVQLTTTLSALRRSHGSTSRHPEVAVEWSDGWQVTFDESSSSFDDASGVRVLNFMPSTDKHDVPFWSGGFPKDSVPLTTYLLLLINGGFFLWLWNSRTDPSEVALNSRIYQDFGRSYTGQLAHFEAWHLGINMMSLHSLGGMLEKRVYGSIPLLLYTMSFLPLLALVVVAIQHLAQRFGWNSPGRLANNAPSFPSMVGFSGVLFAWMVVSTLEGSRSCPIFFMPSFCFDTFQVGGLRLSWGPVVQLVFLQAILRRASFSGHLAGILVGFAWHWGILPPLEWLQPCIFFPLLWAAVKFKRLSRCEPNFSTPTGLDLVLQRLILLRNILVVHGLILVFLHFDFSSLALSQFVLICVLSVMIHFGDKDSERFGVCGRGYAMLVLVLLVTDGLTLGGWLATLAVWQNAWYSVVLLLSRSIIFGLTLSLTCHGLDVCQEFSSNGTWHMFVCPMLEPFRLWGKQLSPRIETGHVLGHVLVETTPVAQDATEVSALV